MLAPMLLILASGGVLVLLPRPCTEGPTQRVCVDTQFDVEAEDLLPRPCTEGPTQLNLIYFSRVQDKSDYILDGNPMLTLSFVGTVSQAQRRRNKRALIFGDFAKR